MREPSDLKKHVVLSLLTLGCVMVDAGVLLVLGAGLKWLAAATSPFVLAGLAAIVILIVRVGWSVRSVRRLAVARP